MCCVGFPYNMSGLHQGGDDARGRVRSARDHLGGSRLTRVVRAAVVHLEARPTAAHAGEADVDLVFNIAEGLEVGRNREAQVPALCELLGIPYTGSDSATLAIALDKS